MRRRARIGVTCLFVSLAVLVPSTWGAPRVTIAVVIVQPPGGGGNMVETTDTSKTTTTKKP